MNNSGEVFVLLKFSDGLENLKALRERGLVYMNTLDYFRKLEEERDSEVYGRADKFEGSSRIWQPQGVELTFTAPGFGSCTTKPGDLVAPVIYHSDGICH